MNLRFVLRPVFGVNWCTGWPWSAPGRVIFGVGVVGGRLLFRSAFGGWAVSFGRLGVIVSFEGRREVFSPVGNSFPRGGRWIDVEDAMRANVMRYVLHRTIDVPRSDGNASPLEVTVLVTRQRMYRMSWDLRFFVGGVQVMDVAFPLVDEESGASVKVRGVLPEGVSIETVLSEIVAESGMVVDAETV